MKDVCARFVSLLEKGEYYEAHEVLEELWFPRRFEKSAEVLLIKGYINASTAFELAKRGRRDAALRTWRVYLKYRPLRERLDTQMGEVCRGIEDVLERIYISVFEK